MPGGLRLLGEGFVYQEDNDPKHSSHLCRGYLERKEKLGRQMNSRLIIISKICYLSLGVLKRMVWPPQSPDLNPIEQVWDFVKSRLEESNRVTVRTIWMELEKAWKMITPELIQRYISTMADRCRAVILAKGGHTRYLKKSDYFHFRIAYRIFDCLFSNGTKNKIGCFQLFRNICK